MTLIELLVSIAIVLIIIPVLYTMIESLYDQHASTFARSLALTATSETMRGMVLDIRSAVYSDEGTPPLVDIATSTFTFYTDTDLDGHVERVRYALSGDTLQKGVIEPTATSSYPTSTEMVYTLSTRIVNNETGVPLFRYWSATSSEITTSSRKLDIRRITVTLVGESRMRGVTGSVLIESSASIRNLKNTY